MVAMRIFTLDIGTGTQDFMLYVEGENIRNCPKAVMPSPTKIMAKKIAETAEKGMDILLTGYTMGGGPCVKAIKEALGRVNVYAFEKPALTINDNLERVREMGVKIVDEPLDNAEEIFMTDFDGNAYRNILEGFNLGSPDAYVIAVQDHGFSPEMSNRKFRFEMFREILKKSPYLESFLYHSEKVPEHYNRMRSAVEALMEFSGNSAEIYVIDTVFAAIGGAMLDAIEFPALVMNFGNGHTVFAVVDRDGRIYSLMEHHTSIIRNMNVEKLVGEFVRGELDNETVYEQGGHGAWIDSVVDVKDFVKTGPNAHLANFREANPAGDVMIVGNLGMVSLLKNYEFLAGV